MSTIPETISVLEEYNKWRRGDETISMPDPFEVGVAIGDAVRLLRELTAEREKVRVMREALENLRDEQNGAPLCTRETEWKEAMDKADDARLDWLEFNGRFGYKAGTVWSDYFAVDLSGGEKTTLRAAIDAAMKGTP